MLRQLEPAWNPGRYVFAVVSSVPSGATPVVVVAEPEGTTVVVEQEQADRFGLDYDYVAAWITLRVHSSLFAVGLTGAVATRLARAQISCNMVAGYYHDHLFVPYERAQDALGELAELAEAAVPRPR